MDGNIHHKLRHAVESESLTVRSSVKSAEGCLKQPIDMPVVHKTPTVSMALKEPDEPAK